MSVPSLAEVRAAGQPPGLRERRNEEHWAGRWYMRDISPLFSWLSIRAGIAPNTLTYLMILSGLLGGLVFALGGDGWLGLLSALGGALLVQVYLLLDCVDGEVARVTGRTSVAGVFLDRIGHYASEVALLAGLGVRAQGSWSSGGWVILGLAAALGAALIKAETDNVVVARAKSGLPVSPPAGDAALAPRSSGLALARRFASLLGFHRIIGAVELSLLALAAAVFDLVLDDLTVTRVLVVAAVCVALSQTVLHMVSILASRRLK